MKTKITNLFLTLIYCLGYDLFCQSPICDAVALAHCYKIISSSLPPNFENIPRIREAKRYGARWGQKQEEATINTKNTTMIMIQSLWNQMNEKN